MTQQQSITDLLTAPQRPLLSYEFFPPKDDEGMAMLENAASALKPTCPDFVTVTYGAGGSTRTQTLRVCRTLAELGMTPVMHHLTCVGASQTELREILDIIRREGIRNIMALRGDPPRGEKHFQKHPDGFSNAAELVRFIKQSYPDMCCGVAGYPETHQEAVSSNMDIHYLKAKVDAGGAFVTTQLFYDNQLFYDFVDRCRKAGIEAPIIPGLLPPLSLKQLQRMANMCQASLPQELLRQMEAAGEDASRTEEVGIEWTVNQIKDLLAHRVPGIHLYILNRSKAVLAPALIKCFRPES